MRGPGLASPPRRFLAELPKIGTSVPNPSYDPAKTRRDGLFRRGRAH